MYSKCDYAPEGTMASFLKHVPSRECRITFVMFFKFIVFFVTLFFPANCTPPPPAPRHPRLSSWSTGSRSRPARKWPPRSSPSASSARRRSSCPALRCRHRCRSSLVSSPVSRARSSLASPSGIVFIMPPARPLILPLRLCFRGIPVNRSIQRKCRVGVTNYSFSTTCRRLMKRFM